VDRAPAPKSEVENTLLLRNRLALKYAILTVILLTVLGLLAQLNLFDSVKGTVNDGMHTLTHYGKLGMFVIGLISNVTLIILVPYNLPMFTLVIYADSIWDVLALGASTGLGAGIGASISFAVAHSLIMHVEHLEESPLLRWIQRTIANHPHTIPFFVAIVTGTPVPDLMLIIPLAMINYPWKRMIIPMIIGKIFQNIVVALLFRYAADSASSIVSDNINFDLTAILMVIFIMTVLYQVAKARAERPSPPSTDLDTHEMNAVSAD
jgi:hypothetical protein